MTTHKTVTPDELARWFHSEYERLAPAFGYETRTESAVPWDDVPEGNRSLMTACASSVLMHFFVDRMAIPIDAPAPDAPRPDDYPTIDGQPDLAHALRFAAAGREEYARTPGEHVEFCRGQAAAYRAVANLLEGWASGDGAAAELSVLEFIAGEAPSWRWPERVKGMVAAGRRP